MMGLKVQSVLSVFALSLFFAGCAGENLKGSSNPEAIYNEASKLIEKDRFLEATELLNDLKLRFPQSRFFALADLKTGDLYFKQESFTESAAAYGVFVDLYPNHPQADYALSQRIQSYYLDTPELPARDQSTARDAIRTADLFLKRYPNSTFAKSVTEVRIKSLLKLIEKEAYIARFYEKRSQPAAALNRWKGIVENFSELRKDPMAGTYLTEADREIEKLSKLLKSGV